MSFDRFHTDDIVLWRRAEQKDVPTIVALCKRPGTRELFGNVSVPEVLELSFLSIVLETTGGQLAGSLSLHFAPNVPALPASCWEWWVREHYDMDGATASNTLFVHLLTWQSQFGSEYLESLLHAIYLSYSYLRNIVLVMPPGTTPIDVMRTLFTRVLSTTEANDAQTLLLNTREQHVPWLNVRLATPEDNDDVVAILCRMATDLCTEYGDFFASELASREPIEEDDAEAWEPSSDVDPSDVPRTLIVAEVEERAMAVMCLSGEVDLAFLERSFNLTAFQGFRQSTGESTSSDDFEQGGSNQVKVQPSMDSIRIGSNASSAYASSMNVSQLEEFEAPTVLSSATTFSVGSQPSIHRFVNDILLDVQDTSTPPGSLIPLVTDSSLTVESLSELEVDRPRHQQRLTAKVKPQTLVVPVEEPRDSAVISKPTFSRKATVADSFFSDLDAFIYEMSLDRQRNSPISICGGSSSSSSSEEYILYGDPEWPDDIEYASDICLPEDHGIESMPFYLKNLDDLIAERVIPVTAKQKKSPKQPPQKFTGRCNAFLLELFGINNAYDERLGFQILQAAFELFPGHDFCLMLVPNLFPLLPLLEHFARVLPRAERQTGEQLYAVHRCSLMSQLTVRPSTAGDDVKISQLLTNVNIQHHILKYFHETVKDHKDSCCYIMQADASVIGVAIVSQEQYANSLASHYEVLQHFNPDTYSAETHGTLTHLIVSPLFAPHSRFFLRELLRLSGTSVLYYKFYMEDKPSSVTPHSIPTFLDSFVPVAPRRLSYILSNAAERSSPVGVMAAQRPYSLYIMNARYASFPRTLINARIVVVGPSATAMAFLEALLYNPKSPLVLFSNILLVSPAGLPGEKPPHHVRNALQVRRTPFGYKHMSRVNLRAMVHVVPGVMTDIERTQQFVVVNQDYPVPYDQLLLLCGQQFQCPHYTSNYINKYKYHCPHETTKENGESKSASHVMTPENVFFVNSDIQAARALSTVKRMIIRFPRNMVIVYGKCLDAYSAVQALLTFGVRATHLVFVEPLNVSAEKVSCFNDELLELKVQHSMLQLGISVYNFFNFKHWTLSPGAKIVETVTFRGKTQSVTIDCAGMFFYSGKSVHRYTTYALDRAKLFFLERLFINHKFETNDPKILSAGPMTRYSGRYYAANKEHRYYNSVEVGEYLAKRMLLYWDPTLSSEERDLELQRLEEKEKIPRFVKPLIAFCKLPGDIHYLRIEHPGPPVPATLERELRTYGFDFETGNPDHGVGYLKLHFNEAHLITELTCYSEDEIDVEAMLRLYHKPLELFKLQDKFLARRFYNTLEFISKRQWNAVYHDRFETFLQDLTSALTETVNPPVIDLVRMVTRILGRNAWETPAREKVDALRAIFRKSKHMDTVQRRTMEFLQNNSDYLVMYVTPLLLRALLRDAQVTPVCSPTAQQL